MGVPRGAGAGRVADDGELAITAEPGQVMLIYSAEPGSPSAERLRLLASWAQAPAASSHEAGQSA
ncbi:hypothetical protein AKH00_17335 [Microbacterium sp. GCS4]|nr:hypothetical protein AKH00_17335 [Microbacterium sp. GCS4]